MIERFTGHVQRLFRDKKYLFIDRISDGRSQSLFAHGSQFTKEDWLRVAVDDKVEFTIGVSDTGQTRAQQVAIVDDAQAVGPAPKGYLAG
ncbi:MAG TPA: cold shock domain-containing protein [Pirellulales bacterium]|jgi:cold shock CspA family protein